jgi:hypothetical protein
MQTGQGTTSNQIAEPIDPLARERRPQHAEHPADLFDKFLVSHRETRQFAGTPSCSDGLGRPRKK